MTHSFSKLITLALLSFMILACSETEKQTLNSTEIAKNIEGLKDSAKELVAKAEEKSSAVVEEAVATVKETSEKTTEVVAKTVDVATTKKTATPPLPADVNFVAGTHYDVLEPAIDVSSENIQVAELFWYGCPHCFRLEPFMLDWKKTKADYVEFVEVPAMFGPQWVFHGKAFYTTVALGIKETTHQKIFDLLHVERKRLSNLSQLQDLLEPLGQSREKVEAAFNSFAVDSNIRSAQLFAQRTGARAVPTIIVDGKYTTSVTKAGGHNQLIQLMNYLAKKAKDERKG